MKVDLKPWLKLRFNGRLEEHGSEWAIPCPDCDDGRTKEYRLWFNVERNLGVCYRCHKSFNAASLLREVDGLNRVQTLQALQDLAGGVGMSMENLREKVEQFFYADDVEDVKLARLPVMAMPEGFVRAARVARTAWPRYLRERIPEETVLFHRLGWCTRGYYRNRLIVPVVLHGDVVTFVARDMTGKAAKKVLYPKGSKTSRILFNYDVAKKHKRIVLVESVFDAMHVGPNATAIFGTHLSDHQVEMIHASQAREAVLLFDGDDAGRAGAIVAAKRLGSSLTVRVATLPDGKDPDDLPASRLERIVKRASHGSDLASHVRRSLSR